MGGCISHRSEYPNEVQPNVFTVYPVSRPASIDAIETSSASDTTTISGITNATGQLEVKANELILHRRGHEPVRWPLQYVRRYGYENQLFSFESGRRCESGPGIFTFRCHRAHELFLLVQSNVQEARSPPIPLQLHPGAPEVADGLERNRSGSMPTQFRFPPGRQFGRLATTSETNATQHRLDSSPRSPKQNENGCLDGSNDPNTSSNVPTAQHHDEVNVFMEVTPQSDELRRLQNRVNRLSSVRSHESSATSDRSFSSAERQQPPSNHDRPSSFEFALSPTLCTLQDEADSSAFASPSTDQVGTMTPTTPVSVAHYVNVDPQNQSLPRIRSPSNAHSYHNKRLLGLRKAPGRSQSLGSASPDRLQFLPSNPNVFTSQSPNSTLSSPSHRSRANTGPFDTNENFPLNYVVVDVTRSSMATGRNTWTSSTASALYRRYLKKQGDQETGDKSNGISGFNIFGIVGRNLKLSEPDASNENQCHLEESKPVASGTSNYAHIDCKRTKALRQTTAAVQMQRRSTSCSASSSDAAVTNEPTIGRRKHDSLAFWAKKPTMAPL